MLTSLQKIVAPEKIVALMPQPFADHFVCIFTISNPIIEPKLFKDINVDPCPNTSGLTHKDAVMNREYKSTTLEC